MWFFTKRTMVFRMKGNKAKWQEAKTALKEQGIDISSGSYPSEIIGG